MNKDFVRIDVPLTSLLEELLGVDFREPQERYAAPKEKSQEDSYCRNHEAYHSKLLSGFDLAEFDDICNGCDGYETECKYFEAKR